MKEICFIRHAKSSWSDSSLSDEQRPLNKRGLRDAPFMAKLLQGKLQKVDKIVSSPAVRAYTTATYFAEAFGIDSADIQVEKAIYEAWTTDIVELVQSFDNQWDKVLVFGHNPTFTSVANLFSEKYIANMPTCCIAHVKTGIQAWSEFSDDKGELISLYYPKQYFD